MGLEFEARMSVCHVCYVFRHFRCNDLNIFLDINEANVIGIDLLI